MTLCSKSAVSDPGLVGVSPTIPLGQLSFPWSCVTEFLRVAFTCAQLRKTGQQIPQDLHEIASGGGGIAQGWGARGGGKGGGGGMPVLNGEWGGKYAQNGGGRTFQVTRGPFL